MALYQFPPLCSSVDGICCAFPAFLLPGGGKTRLQGEDLLEVEPLVCRVRVMVLRVVFCAENLYLLAPSAMTARTFLSTDSGNSFGTLSEYG